MMNILAKKTNHTLLSDEEKTKAEGLYTQAQEDIRKLMDHKDRIVASSAEKDHNIQELVRSQEITADQLSERDRRIQGMAQAQASMSGQITSLNHRLRYTEEECYTHREEVVFHAFEQQALATRLAE